MGTPIFQVDAFTDKPFLGNPAAVCLIPGPRPERWMQDVAREMNLSETAFLYRTGEEFNLRWFTPLVEVDLCGHATLAAAHVLWENGVLDPSTQARFQTRSGLLVAERRGDWIEMDFPATPEAEAEPPPGLAEALGVEPVYVGRSRFDYLVQAKSEDAVRKLDPDFRALAALDVRGVAVTSRSEDGAFDFVSRFFAPSAGINEDPVTGSAHCCLGPFWSARLGRTELTGLQASARGGIVRVRVDGERVRLGGRAVTVLRGDLRAE